MEKNKCNFYNFFFFCGEEIKKELRKIHKKFPPKAEEHNFS